MSLTQYNRKRDFKKTQEPRGGIDAAKLDRFVIQKHAASRLHYDLRLEMGGTLKSWAVPKGMPYKKGEKHLAVQVEDHPISYINFEGTIPKGQYGGGTVMVWDLGHYKPLSDHPEKDLAAGKLHFELRGEKLLGEWYLVRLRDNKNWLLVRGRENMKPISQRLDETSALSGRTMEAIGQSVEVRKPNQPAKKDRAPGKSSNSEHMPGFIEPMQARLLTVPPRGKWIYEIKFDGFRALACKHGGAARLRSRNDKDLSKRFPGIFESVGELEASDFVLDGEIVALDQQGRSSFQLLQGYEPGPKQPPVVYYVFDLLRLAGENLQPLPLEERKRLLKTLLGEGSGWIRYSTSMEGDAAELLKQARRLDLEGLIGKRAGSIYEPGRRSGAWIKLKFHHEQEMVIGGFTEPRGGRNYFGSLLVGYYERRQLLCAGKVGTGFDDSSLRALSARFEPLLTPACPFKNLPEKQSGRYGAGITAAEMRRCQWLKPALVCQVKYAEWTRDGKLRHPVFLGLREDKPAREVVRETPK